MSTLNEATIIRVRNVNQALSRVRSMLRDPRRDYYWRDISPRGLQTLEYRGPVITEYQEPVERVLWSPHRDANPFFHLMESLWILAGRKDVAFLKEFNTNIAAYSDNGEEFHAPYGYRLRNWDVPDIEYDTGIGPMSESGTLDQIAVAIDLLSKDHSTRQVVLSIWNPYLDLGRKTKDMPCNDLLMFKIRDGALDMTVACRSNDIIWGAYGANIVQFSTLQEFIASAVGVPVGIYRQVSDSFHVYTDQPAWKNVCENPDYRIDPYQDIGTGTFPLFTGLQPADWQKWLAECVSFCEGRGTSFRFFKEVAEPMRLAWRVYKNDSVPEKHRRAMNAIAIMENAMPDCDWQFAGIQWMTRRGGGVE